MEEMTNLRKLQLEEKKLLDLFVDICDKNNLRYYMLGGTLLGAIRHEGFIPWDDDVDVCMPRVDYDKFLEIAKNFIEEPCYLDCAEQNKTYRYCFARIATSKMKLRIGTANLSRDEDIWIDVIPMDGMPENKLVNAVHKLKLRFWRGMNQLAQYDELVDQKRKRGTIETIIVKIAGLKIFHNLVKYPTCIANIRNTLKKYAYDDCDTVINYMAAYGFKETFQRSWFGNGTKYKFEDGEYTGPDNYDAVLRTIYGEYMVLPPESDRNKHCSEIIEG